MLGYMTKQQAMAHGLTHHGSYYGIPLWVKPGARFMVATKWAPFEYLMTLFQYIEGALGGTFFPENEPAFMFKVGSKIEPAP